MKNTSSITQDRLPEAPKEAKEELHIIAHDALQDHKK